jgi:tol-pal system protein YbgF
MTIRLTTTRALVAVGFAIAYIALTPARPAAADREHQQIMADLRMLQEQTQQLQALMNDLGEALKAVTTRLDEQTSLERKSFADGKVQLDTLTGDLRVVREKVDETNVRLGTVTQELESIRQAIPEPGMMPAPSTPTTELGVAPGTTPSPISQGATTAPPGVQPQKLFEASRADYYSGNYELAISGFDTFLKYFPKSAQAHEAQLLIGESLFNSKKHIEAVAAYNRVIANYPGSPSVPQAYYKRGTSQQQLGEAAQARESYETVLKQFPDSQAATLAQQRLESLPKPKP